MRNGTSRDTRTRNRRHLPPVAQFGAFGPSSPLRNPRPPYSWLDEESLESIHQASLTIFEEIGLDFFDAEALSLWAEAGERLLAGLAGFGPVDADLTPYAMDRAILLEKNPARSFLI